MTYAEKLLDPRWQKKRLEILSRDRFQCFHCRDAHSTLHVHHIKYVSRKSPWDYDDDDLLTLCKACHDQVEKLKSDIGEMICNLRYRRCFTRLYDHFSRTPHDENIENFLNNYTPDGSYNVR